MSVIGILIGLSGLLLVAALCTYLPVAIAERARRVRDADEAIARRAARYAVSGLDEEASDSPDSRLAPLEARLAAAGTRTPAATWLLRTSGLSALSGVVIWIVTASPIAALAATGLVAFAMYLRVWAAGRQRTSRFEAQLCDALPMMAENLRSGQSPARALLTVASYMEDPLKAEFEQASHEMGLGLSLSAAMDAMLERVPCNDLRLLNGVIAINAESGGDLSGILDSIAETMQTRARMRAHVKSITASGRLSAAIVAALPWLTLAGLYVTSPGYLQPMFEPVWAGIAIIAVVAVMDAIGFAITRRMFAIEID